MRLILASASPRRAELLRSAGIRFEALASEVDEIRSPGETVPAMVLRLAEAKARASAAQIRESKEPALVIGADTAVELDGKAFGKPGSAEVARMMLEKLSGRTHRVVTGVVVIRFPDGAIDRAVETTSVWLASLSEKEIAQYSATGEPLDKAGGYAIQGFAGRFVERVEGCYFNVVGLPLSRLYRMLIEMGWQSEDN